MIALNCCFPHLNDECASMVPMLLRDDDNMPLTEYVNTCTSLQTGSVYSSMHTHTLTHRHQFAFVSRKEHVCVWLQCESTLALSTHRGPIQWFIIGKLRWKGNFLVSRIYKWSEAAAVTTSLTNGFEVVKRFQFYVEHFFAQWISVWNISFIWGITLKTKFGWMCKMIRRTIAMQTIINITCN